MTNGIAPELNELLSFASTVGEYVGNQSTWKVQRTATAPEHLLQVVPLTLMFEAETVLSNRSVRCEYLINSRWLLAQPRVKSSAPWLRRNIDWHVFDDGGLCWVYPPHYREVLRKLSRHLERSDLIRTAAYWCVARSADLVEKHLIADQHALKSWPPEWNAWGHGEEAKQQFEDMARRGKIDVEVEYLLAARRAQAT